MPWTPPESAKSFGFRPLSKGMVASQASQLIPDGSFVSLVNMMANMAGPRRRPGYEEFAGGDSVPYRPIDILTVVSSAGAAVTLLLTDKTLFLVNARTGFTEVAWAYSTGTITVSGASVTGAGTAWTTNDIQPGDLIRVGTEEAEIVEVTGAGAITIAAGSLTNGAGLSYSIQRSFSPGTLNSPVWSASPSKVAIADGKHQLLAYDIDAGTLGYWTTNPAKQPPNGAVVPAVVTYFADRIFQGNIIDPVDGTRRSRILWSTLADETDFSFPENYTELPYTGGSLLRLLGLNQYLMAYFDDGVYTGYPTNYPTLPFRFERRETGNVGLVSTRGISSYIGGHFFIGQNNFYFTNGENFKPLADDIDNLLRTLLDTPMWSYVTVDPANSSILFGPSKSDDTIGIVWRMDIKTGAWSQDVIPIEMLSNPWVNSALSWEELSGTTWDALGGTYSSWNTMKVAESQRRVVVSNSSKIWRGSSEGRMDFTINPVDIVVLSKDHDFDDSDGLKVFTRLGIKTDALIPRTLPIEFSVEISTNRGVNYRSIGNLVIPAGKDEGYINFRATGSTFRFRLRSSSDVSPYYISEYTLRVIGFGEELDVSTH